MGEQESCRLGVYTETVYISRFAQVMASYCPVNLDKFGFLYEYLNLIWRGFSAEKRV